MCNKVVIAGGTGFIGKVLVRELADKFRKITVLTRGQNARQNGVKYVHWNGKKIGAWAHEIDGADLLINLAGKSVDCRYSEENKEEILNSRIDSTLALGAAVIMAQQPPKAWVNAGSATIYEHSEHKLMDEISGKCGHEFSETVCRKWEQTFNDIPVPGTRKVLLRMAIVLGSEGGVAPRLGRLVRLGLGSPQGNGSQQFSWIHEQDLVDMIVFALENEEVQGTYNCCAPNPIPNRDLMKEIRRKLRMPFAVPQPVWLIELGTRLCGTEAELVLKSRNVFPRKMLNAGFRFTHPRLPEALKTLTL